MSSAESPEQPPTPTTEPAPMRVGSGIDFSDPNSPLAPFYFRTIHIVAAAVIVIVFVLCSFFPLWHTDVWGHLKYGEWMIQNGRIPDREPFSPWWDGRQEFTQYYTITQAIMYWSYIAGERLAGGNEVQRMAGGIEMLRALHGVLTAARFLFMLFAFVRISKSWNLAVLGMFLMIFLDMSNIAVFRPQTFAQVFFAALLLPLSRDVLSKRSLILIPLLLVVWANSHGSYVVALVVLSIVLAGRAIEAYLREPRVWFWRDRACQRLALVLVVSALAIAFGNPYGPEFYRRTFALTQHPSLTGGVGEWKPLLFEWARGWHWIFMISVAVIALTQFFDRKRIPADQLLLVLAFGIGCGLQTRFVIWWALVLPWVLIARWAGMSSTISANTEKPNFRKTMLAVLLGWAFLMWSGLAGWLTQGKPQEVELAASSGTPWQVAMQLKHPENEAFAYYPELTEILKKHYPNGRYTGSIMATPMQGDYLLWALAPDIPVTYAHIHLFHPDYWAEIGIVGQGRPGWWEILDKYSVNMIVVEAEFSKLLREQLQKSPGWKILVDETGDVQKKPNDLTRHLIAVRLEPMQ